MTQYDELDLSLNGEVAKRLMDHLGNERGYNLDLIDHGNNEPAGITPAMRNWFQSDIAGHRISALKGVEEQLNLINREELGDPVILEKRLWEINQEHIRARRAATAKVKTDEEVAYED